MKAREKHGNSHQTTCILSINTWAARRCPSPALPVPGSVVITTHSRAICFFTYTDRPQEIRLGAWSWSHWPAGAGALHPSLAGPPLALLPTHACCSAHKDGPDPLPSQEVSEPSLALSAVGTVPLVMLSPGLLGIRAPAWGPAVPAVVLLSPAVEQTTTAQTPHVYCHPQFVREEVGSGPARPQCFTPVKQLAPSSFFSGCGTVASFPAGCWPEATLGSWCAVVLMRLLPPRSIKTGLPSHVRKSRARGHGHPHSYRVLLLGSKSWVPPTLTGRGPRKGWTPGCGRPRTSQRLSAETPQGSEPHSTRCACFLGKGSLGTPRRVCQTGLDLASLPSVRPLLPDLPDSLGLCSPLLLPDHLGKGRRVCTQQQNIKTVRQKSIEMQGEVATSTDVMVGHWAPVSSGQLRPVDSDKDRAEPSIDCI